MKYTDSSEKDLYSEWRRDACAVVVYDNNCLAPFRSLTYFSTDLVGVSSTSVEAGSAHTCMITLQTAVHN